MITTITSTTATTTITTAAVSVQLGGIGVLAILLLIFLLILRDISMVGLIEGKTNNNKSLFFSSFVNASSVFIIPLVYVFSSIILYKLLLIL